MGNGKVNPLSIGWDTGTSALWLRRKALIHPRFRLVFTVNIRGVPWYSPDRLLPVDGFTAILSKTTTNYLSIWTINIGYDGIYDALVTEFDLFRNDILKKDAGDSGQASLSYHRCRASYCSGEEIGTRQYPLAWRYEASNGLNFDVVMDYNARDRELKTSINTRYIGAQPFDALAEMDGEAWVGFTGAIIGTLHRDLRFYNAYMCEDDYEYFNLRWAANGGSEITIPANGNSRVHVTPYNVEGSIVTAKSDFISNYNLRAGSSCGSTSQVNRIESESSTFFFDVAGCTKAGNHVISLNSGKGENRNKLNFTITPRGYEKVVLNEKVDTVGNQRFIKGGRQNGDYIESDFHGFISFKLSTFDSFDNSFDLSDKPDEIERLLGVFSNYPSGGIGKVVCQKTQNGQYTINVPIKEIGLYKITLRNPSPQEWFFGVLSGAPVIEKSILQLKSASGNPIIKGSPQVKVGDTITSECKLVDSLDKTLKGVDVTTVHQGNFKCEVVRTSLSGNKKIYEGVVSPSNSGFECSFVVVDIGVHQINGSLRLKDSNFKLVPSGLNTFTAVFSPSDIQKTRYFNPANLSFNSDWSNPIINFSSTNQYITLLDFLSIEGDSIARENGKYYDTSFDASSIKARIYAEDSDKYTTNCLVESTLYEGGKYFALKVAKSDYFKKTSGFYIVEITLNNKTTKLKIKYPLGDTKGQKVCIGDVYPDWTLFIPDDNAPNLSMWVGQDRFVGDINLRTEQECLYNYWVEDDRWGFNTKGAYVKKADIEGFYKLNLLTSEVGDHYMEVTFDNYEFVGGYLVTVKPKDIISKIVPVDAKNKWSDRKNLVLADQSNDEDVNFCFNGLDDAGNRLTTNPMDRNKYMGIKLNVKINGKSNFSKFQRRETSNITFDRKLDCYTFTDYYKEVGNYEVIITGAETDLNFTLKYYKRPGKTDINKSRGTISSEGELVFSKTATASLTLVDKFGAYIASDEAHMQNELKNLKVIALSDDKSYTSSFSYKKREGNAIILESESIKKSDKFDFIVTYNDFTIPCNERCLYKVRFGDIFIKNTKTSIILSKTTPIDESTTQQIANTKDIPVFSSLFYDDGNNFIGKIDTTKETFSAKIVGSRFDIDLSLEWVNSNQLYYSINKDDYEKFKNAVSTSQYTLQVSYKNKQELSYPLKFLGDGEDNDAGNGEKDVSKTVLDKDTVETVAGVEGTFRIELRTADNLRVNKFEDLKMFRIDNKEKDESFKYEINNGVKKGTYIVKVFSTNRTNPNFNLLTIFISEIQVPATVKHIVYCSNLTILKFLTSSLKDETNHVLLDGRATDTSNFDFMAFDNYGNLYDPIFDAVAFSPNRISNLFSYEHSEGENVIASAVTNPAKSLVTLTVKSTKIGIVTISTRYMQHKYTTLIKPGPVSSDRSYVEVQNTKITAGEKLHCNIHPHDKYDNHIDEIQQEDKEFFAMALHEKPTEQTIQLVASEIKLNEKIIVKSSPINVAGQSILKADYKGETLRCTNCNVEVAHGPVDYPKTSVFRVIDGVETAISTKATLNLQVSSLPLLRLKLNDSFLNRYTSIPKNTSYRPQLIADINVELCSEIIDDHIEIKVCPDAQSRNVWKYLTTREYNLKITRSCTDNSCLPESLDIKTIVEGGEDNKDASNAEMDIDKTSLSKDLITVVAGKIAQFNIEVRTNENKRKNYWLLEFEKKVQITFSKDNDASFYKREIELGEKPGQYVVKFSSTKTYTKEDNNEISVTIDGQTCKTSKVKVIVEPDVATKGELKDILGNNISLLPESNADSIYRFVISLYDKFGNYAKGSCEELSYEVRNPDGKKFTSNCNKFSDNYSYRIDFRPTIAGRWSFKQLLISDKAFEFDIIPGQVNPQNSKMEVPTNIVAGNTIKITITPYDSYGNYVNPETLALNPFNIQFKSSLTPSTYSNYEAIQDEGKVGRKINKDKIKDNSKKRKNKEFIIGKKSQKINIRDYNGKCLVAKEGKFVVNSNVDCDSSVTIEEGDERWFRFKIGEKNCLKESNTGLLVVECSTDSIDQLFRLKKNFDQSIFVTGRVSNLVWQTNSQGDIVPFRLQGGSNQQFFFESLNSEGSFDKSVKRLLQSDNDAELPVIEYEYTPRKASEYIFRTTIDNTECRCENCNLSVNPGQPFFPNSSVSRMPEAGGFVNMEKIFAEDNTKKYPIYQICGNDKFGNRVREVEKSKYSMTLIDPKKIEYKLQARPNADAACVEFVHDDVNNANKYENLVAGEYSLRIAFAEEEPLLYTVNLLGLAEKDGDSTNDPLDIQQTEIREPEIFKSNAGVYIQSIIKLKTKSGSRRNEWGHKIGFTSTNDIDFKVQNAGKKGTYLIQLMSKTANDFPSPAREILLTIFVNDVEVVSLKPRFTVSPNAMNSCKVSSADLQDKNVLRSGNADKPLTFAVECFDLYNNECPVVLEDLEIKVNDSNGNRILAKATTSRVRGQATFEADTKIAGDYTVEANPKYLTGKFTYRNEPGVLVRENTDAVVVEKTVVAGKNAVLKVTLKDQYNNIITPEIVKDRVSVSVNTPSGKDELAVGEIKDKNILFPGLVKEKGRNLFNINIDNKILSRAELTFTVNPGPADLNNSSIECNSFTPKPLVTLTNEFTPTCYGIFRDFYNNEIDIINTAENNVQNCQITGRNSKVIDFTTSLSADSSKIEVKVTSYPSVRAFSRLVHGEGYNFTCLLKASNISGKKESPLAIRSIRDDTGFGNGDFVATNTEFSKPKLSIIAGERTSVDIILKTVEKLLFNDNLEINKTFKIDLKFKDDNFKYEISRKGFSKAVFTLDLMTSSIFADQQEIIFSITEPGKDEAVELKQQSVSLLVLPKLPPKTDLTEFIESPGAVHPAGKPVTFKYKLYDDFSNPIINNPAISSYIILTNDGILINSVTELSSDGLYFITTANVAYPPRNAKLQLFYKDSINLSEINNKVFEVFFESTPNLENLKISCTNNLQMRAGESLNCSVNLFDDKGVCMDTDKPFDIRAEIYGPDNSNSKAIKCPFKIIKNPSLKECINSYVSQCSVNDRGIVTGDYNIKVLTNDKEISTFKQVVTNGPIDINKFVLSNQSQNINYNSLVAGTEFKQRLNARDEFGNAYKGDISAKLKISIKSKDDKELDSKVVSLELLPSEGQIDITANIKKSGSYYVSIIYDGKDVVPEYVNNLAIIKVVASEVSGEFTDYSNLVNASVGKENGVTFALFDRFGNSISQGKQKIKCNVFSVKNRDYPHSCHDNADGTYTLTFIPDREETYQFQVNIGEDKIYGTSPVVFTVKNPECKGETSIRCPADASKCVADIRDCIEKSKRCEETPNTPFMVTLVGESYCRKHQTDADCAKGFDKCDIQPFCVAKENTKNVCPKPKETKCADGEVLCLDGLCRKNLNQCASRRACPIDFKLCPNGTCSLTIDGCSKSQECGSNQVRCVNDQTCADSYDKCASPVVCPKNNMVVCPDNTCKNSELECSSPKICSGENNVTCQDGTCVTDIKNCLKGVVCSPGLAFCAEGNKCVDICNAERISDSNLTAEELAIRLKPNWELEELMRKKRLAEEAERKKLEEEKARIAAEEEKKRKEAEENARIAAEEEKKKKQAEAVLAEKLRQIKEAAERAAREAAERVRQEAERLRINVCTNNRNWLNSNVYNRVPLYSTVGREILNGSSIKLMHLNTGQALHSHGDRYPSGSRQQEVTGYWSRDNNDWFRIFLVSGSLQNGGIVRLQHNQTGASIFIDNGNLADRSRQLECSTRPYNGDERFHFRIEVITPTGCDSALRVGDLVRLVNVGTNATLHSHDIRNNGTGQYEVTGFQARDTNDYYVFAEESH